MLFRNIEDFEDDLIGEKNKINLKGIDKSTFNIIVDQTNKSGILTGIGSNGELNFPTCDTIKLPKGSTAEIKDRPGIKISCDEVQGMPYNKISCMDGDSLTECCGKEVCSKDGGCYQIQYNKETSQFNCVGGTPSELDGLIGCDSNNGCIAATDMENAMSQKTCVNLCQKYKKCDNKNLVTVYSTTNSDEFYDYKDYPNNPCNLKNETVQLKGSVYCSPEQPDYCIKKQNVINPKVCDLVNRNKNGCNDVDHGLNPNGLLPLKNGVNCDIHSINNIPFGVDVTAYGEPCTNIDPLCWAGVGPCGGHGNNHCCSGSFANEKDMCPMGGNCGSHENPQYFNHNNTGSLEETSCSMSFRLGTQNQHACD